jgi:uncharacterized protein (TIGR03435 family)
MMETELLRLAAVLLLPYGPFAQAPAAPPAAGPAVQQLEFEVATIKPRDPDRPMPAGSTGGPGTADPGRISYRMTLRRLLVLAYEVTGEQVMLQHLLAERFRMTLHHELQDKLAYDLTVAKTGLKLKETLYADAKPASNGSMDFTLDKNDFPILPEGSAVQARATWVKNGSMRATFRAYSIAALARDLVGVLTLMITVDQDPTRTFVTRVIAKTGLTGRYDFTLEYSGLGDDASGPSIFSAVEKQLGLKLDKSKAPLDAIVIDHIDKVPTKN